MKEKKIITLTSLKDGLAREKTVTTLEVNSPDAKFRSLRSLKVACNKKNLGPKEMIDFGKFDFPLFVLFRPSKN